MRLLLLSIALLAAAAPEAAFRIDPALVDSLSSAPQGLMRAEPYLVHFRKGALNLYFVSALHESREDSKTFAVIRKAFASFPIRSVIVEGRVNGKEDVSARDARGIALEARKGRYKAGEVDYAIALASKKGILAVGGEPSGSDELAGLRRAGFSVDDALGIGFVSMIPSYRIRGRLATEGLESLFDETMRWRRMEFGIPREHAFDFRAFERWHAATAGAAFDPATVDYDTVRPDSKGTVFQRMADASTNVRNRFLAGVISRELREHEHVLAVYGNGHHAAQRRALVAAFGEPVYEGALADPNR